MVIGHWSCSEPGPGEGGGYGVGPGEVYLAWNQVEPWIGWVVVRRGKERRKRGVSSDSCECGHIVFKCVHRGHAQYQGLR